MGHWENLILIGYTNLQSALNGLSYAIFSNNRP